jgi:hypothetical protein
MRDAGFERTGEGHEASELDRDSRLEGGSRPERTGAGGILYCRPFRAREYGTEVHPGAQRNANTTFTAGHRVRTQPHATGSELQPRACVRVVGQCLPTRRPVLRGQPHVHPLDPDEGRDPERRTDAGQGEPDDAHLHPDPVFERTERGPARFGFGLRLRLGLGLGLGLGFGFGFGFGFRLRLGLGLGLAFGQSRGQLHGIQRDHHHERRCPSEHLTVLGFEHAHLGRRPGRDGQRQSVARLAEGHFSGGGQVGVGLDHFRTGQLSYGLGHARLVGTAGRRVPAHRDGR